MGAPVIEWISPGIGFVPEAAASFRRLTARLGRTPDSNSTYRDWGLQMSMYLNWEEYEAGRGPWPGHSRAIHPSLSRHTSGLALDSDDWMTPGFNELAAEYGWIRTAANDPTERHHFEYQWWRDEHRNDPAPAGETVTPESEEDDMKDKYCYTKRADGTILNAIYNTISGYFQAFESNDGPYNTAKAQGHDIAATFEVSASDFASIEAACAAVRAG